MVLRAYDKIKHCEVVWPGLVPVIVFHQTLTPEGYPLRRLWSGLQSQHDALADKCAQATCSPSAQQLVHPGDDLDSVCGKQICGGQSFNLIQEPDQQAHQGDD